MQNKRQKHIFISVPSAPILGNRNHHQDFRFYLERNFSEQGTDIIRLIQTIITTFANNTNSFQFIIFAKSFVQRSRSREQQCAQNLKEKVAQVFPKVAQNVDVSM